LPTIIMTRSPLYCKANITTCLYSSKEIAKSTLS
jgi:hypothetical protein